MSLPIPDMHLLPLASTPQGVVLLSEHDHVLRRFGELSLEALAAGSQGAYSLRQQADRLLVVLDGACRLRLLDLREHSPSHGVHAELALEATQQAVLVPFGVACSLAADAPARLLWLSTHSPQQDAARQLSAEDLAAYPPAERT